jgi:hypothetical protein
MHMITDILLSSIHTRVQQNAGVFPKSNFSEFSFPPPSHSRRHLHCSSTPVLAVVVPFFHAANSRTFQRLIFRERGKDPEYDRHARVELHAHECVRDALADVFEMHGRTLDEHADRNYCVEWPIVGARKRS